MTLCSIYISDGLFYFFSTQNHYAISVKTFFKFAFCVDVAVVAMVAMAKGYRVCICDGRLDELRCRQQVPSHIFIKLCV